MEAQSLTAERLNQQPASPSHLIHFSGCFNEFHKAFLLFHKTDQSFFYEIIIRHCSERGKVKGRGHTGSKQSDISLNKSDIPDIFRWIPDIRDPELLLTVSPCLIPGQVLTLLNYPKIEKNVINILMRSPQIIMHVAITVPSKIQNKLHLSRWINWPEWGRLYSSIIFVCLRGNEVINPAMLINLCISCNKVGIASTSVPQCQAWNHTIALFSVNGWLDILFADKKTWHTCLKHFFFYLCNYYFNMNNLQNQNQFK